MFTFHQPCNANERILFTHVSDYESTIMNNATYCRSYTPNALAFSSLSIRTQVFTYIKVYESRIHSPSST
ncbi:hypothetical protein F383_21097 [Gossypium arboreum]|uniref:Uncharacterized protein n=1 Tax=Gossypium arboreum TaxID=29729 RepID=A0A0B0MPB5_GOSAR|nr:hypothetical protein F383_21097 [Gossypium arboreum]